MLRHVPVFIMMIALALNLAACQKKTGHNVAQAGKVIARPEVKVYQSSTSTQQTPPSVEDLRWDFYKEPNHQEMTCKFKIKVTFKEESRYNAKILFMDINRFTVTSESIKFIGKKNEETTYEKSLYIDPKLSARITKAEVQLSPIH